jgi:hypothetical protein
MVAHQRPLSARSSGDALALQFESAWACRSLRENRPLREARVVTTSPPFLCLLFCSLAKLRLTLFLQDENWCPTERDLFDEVHEALLNVGHLLICWAILILDQDWLNEAPGLDTSSPLPGLSSVSQVRMFSTGSASP